MVEVHVSPEINSLLNTAVELSVRRHHFFVGVEHLFEAVVEHGGRLPQVFFANHGGTLQQALKAVVADGWRGGANGGGEIFYTPRCAEMLAEAARLAELYHRGPATGGHLLYALLADAQSAPSRAMDRLGLGRGDVLAALRGALLTGTPQPAPVGARGNHGAAAANAPGEPGDMAPADASGAPATLESLTRDLTQSAREGRLESAIGRKDEMFQILQILGRKSKNNVMLVGEAGVGKTQIVEGLAVAVVRGGMSGLLSGCRILELNIGALMAGTQYRGALEQKMLDLLKQLKQDPNAILFIDEVHLIMGTGATEGSTIDLANLLKPALARGEIRCIGATTLQEYRKFIEKDPAIERRFQMVRVEPLTEEATLKVLLKLQPSLEQHHGVGISEKAVQAAVTLTVRYMPNRHLPDKAIDVLDQACARYRLKLMAARRAAKEAGQPAPPPGMVTPHDIRKVLSQITAIPIEEMTLNERMLIANLENELKRQITGQDEAVARTTAAVKKARAGLSDPNRPQAVLLFLGPSGVGKTQLAKVLAEVLFGSANHFMQFDMSEYTEAHTVAKLIGAPPGYVGYEEEGLLAAAMRSAPFSVVLFDEIEKAHPRVFDVLLPVLDEGRLKDSRGRMISFRNCFIILTSNIGADVFLQGGDDEERRRQAMEALRAHFRPEFINRLDEIIPFRPLLFEDVRSILELSIREVEGRLKDKNVRLHVYQWAYEHIAEQGYSEHFGARELRRTVERMVAAPIGERLIAGAIKPGQTVEVIMIDGAFTIRVATEDRKE